MELTGKLLSELQRRLKTGNRRGVHLNAIPGNSRYKFDLNRLSHIDESLPNNFIKELLSELPLKFRISWKDNVPDLNTLFENDQVQLVRITRAFENLINQTEAIESEKGINTFGFGFPILARRDQADNKLTVAPILIWSLRIKRTKEFNTWEINRNEDDPIYLNEVLINHLQNDSNIELEPIPSEMLDDGLINKDDLIEICVKIIKSINTKVSDDLEQTFRSKINSVTAIGDKSHYEKLPLNSTNAFIDFGGLFSIFEVQKQNIINDYGRLMELQGAQINLDGMEGHTFQPISSVETDPSQQSILHSLESTRNILIQGPPGTGKSQTLTAVLINALENNKKTIVVCEKRTALEVLHNALTEKGLNFPCVLIRDIVKDRKTVVDSVRQRVDSSEYKRYRYNYSRETLNNIISKAKELIDNINRKHQKLDKKIIGHRAWTDVVGLLLAELKDGHTHMSLDIERNIFEFTNQELNYLLDLVQKGQTLYNDYSPIATTSFINPEKLVGDNPYIIEKAIHDDFEAYTKYLCNIQSLLTATQEEFFSKRTFELKEQIRLLTSGIDKVVEKSKEFEQLIDKNRSAYIEKRNLDLKHQKEAITSACKALILNVSRFDMLVQESKTQYINHRKLEHSKQAGDLNVLITQIEEVYETYKDNKDINNNVKLRSFGYRTAALFSKEKKEIIQSNKKLHSLYYQLNNILQRCRDIGQTNFDENLENNRSILLKLKSDIEITVATSRQASEKEFNSLNLNSSLKISEKENFFGPVEHLLSNRAVSQELRALVMQIQGDISELIGEISLHIDTVNKEITKSPDISFYPELNGAVNEFNTVIGEFLNTLHNKSIDREIEEEFRHFDLSALLNTSDIELFFRSKEYDINFVRNSNSLKSFIPSLRSSFERYINEIDCLFLKLAESFLICKDFIFPYSFTGSYRDKRKTLDLLMEKLEKDEQRLEGRIKNEFEQINFITIDAKKANLYSLHLLQKEIYLLADKVENDNWTRKKIILSKLPAFLKDVEKIIIEKNVYFNGDEDLFTIEFKWFQFYNNLPESYKLVLNALKVSFNWRKSFLIHYLHAMLTNAANLDLPTDDTEHKELDNTLNKVEAEQLKFIKQFWYSKQIDAAREFEQKNMNLSVENLYNKRSSHRYQRLSLRQIVQYDAQLFTTFFPIILTSPDVASNLFRGMNGFFDIVMFDEASQLRLEDNLPALLKGKQIIIAGDEHQMPPSNYFDKVFDGSIEDEEDLEEEDEVVVDKDNILLSCESLLEFGTELNFHKKYLDFHYRSRHPYLIDFSNYAFYNQRLKPLPNSFDYVPIKYIQVNGTFSEHTNEAEAEMVLSIIEKNINRLPNGEYPTVGIATFNIAQRNLIKSKILERQKFSKYDEFNTKVQELEENGMFIKNLENIQGDERDVIILSTTYGIGKDGRFAQRFGPINHSKGYKLLNVIITRAKYKVYVCSSIPEQIFMNYKEYLITEGSNNKRAVFYAYLAYSKAVSDGNKDLRLSVLTTLSENTEKSASFDNFRGEVLESPFEEEVYQYLADRLGTEKLIPQLQFAGFRIDIVYDPKLPGVPKVAIECDGAKYHSSQEAYVYDRHRQKILENHGFVFHRIWSTNWWRNSSREAAKLVEFIKHTEATRRPTYQESSYAASAFTDEIEMVEAYVSQNYFIDSSKDTEVIQTIEKTAPKQSGVFKDEVKLHSKVHVKYINNGKDVKVQLVESENNKNSSISGIQKIYYKSPLATSLLGRTVGDIVKVGNLDNFVEIVQIMN